MDKQTLLQGIKQLAAKNEITQTELLNAFAAGHKPTQESTSHPSSSLSLVKVLYFIGSFIIILGVIILLKQNWANLNYLTKVLVTIGSSIAAYIVGLVLNPNEKTSPIAQAFFLLSATLLPFGVFIVFQHMGYNIYSNAVQALIAGFLLIIYLLSYFVFRYTIFILFNLLFGTWLFYAVTNHLIMGNPYFENIHFYDYRALLVGLCYICFGYYFAQERRKTLSEFLYVLGGLIVLVSAYSLMGWQPNQNIIWEIIFPFLVAIVLTLSVYLRARSLLVLGTIFLMIYIGKITSEYFVNNLGWPLALVIIGLMIIFIGYASLVIYQKYLSKKVVDVHE